MRESVLGNLSLLSWTLQIWTDHRRGVHQNGHPAAIAYCMEHHREWWGGWDRARESGEDASIVKRLAHIHHDAAIKAQLDRCDPPEIKPLFDSLMEKGNNEFESIHTLALALVEENEYASQHDVAFDRARFIERARRFVQEAESRQLVRL